MSKNNFLISGFGRSGTMFLSSVMNKSKKWTVLHEPRETLDEKMVNDKMVSDFNKDYYGEVNSVMRFRYYDINVSKRGLIFRDPTEIITSVANRKTLNRTIELVEDVNKWYSIFNEWIKADTSIIKIKFSKMTTDPDYLKWVLNSFDILDVDVNDINFNFKVNQNKVIKYKAFNNLPNDIIKEYNKFKWDNIYFN